MRGQEWAERMGRFANPKRSTPEVPVDTTAVMALIDSYAWDEASKPAPVTATPPLAVSTAPVEASVAVTEPVSEHQEPASDPPVAAWVVVPLVAPTAGTEPAPVPVPPPVPVADTTREHEPQAPVVARPMVEVASAWLADPTMVAAEAAGAASSPTATAPPVIPAAPIAEPVSVPDSEPTGGSYWDRQRSQRDTRSET